MAKWDDIPIDVAQLIAEHLEFYEDREHFSRVCKQWRLGLKRANYRPSKSQTPLLMLVDPPDNSYRRFYSLINRMHREVDLPPSILHNKDHDEGVRYLSSHGWLISLTTKNLSINIFNPFSRQVIRLPSVPASLLCRHYGGLDEHRYLICFRKFVLSANTFNTSNYSIALIFGVRDELAFWRPGEESWTMPTVNFDARLLVDGCFFRGEFYSIDHYGRVIAYGPMDDKSPERRLPRILANVKNLIATDYCINYAYMVESETEGALLVVNRDVHIGETEYWTKSFCICEVNVENGNPKIVKSLGNRALFVGFNSTIYVEASPERGCKANCIYFTDDYRDGLALKDKFPNGGTDMGVYSLAEGKIIGRPYEGPSRFNIVTPPTWVELCSLATYG